MNGSTVVGCTVGLLSSRPKFSENCHSTSLSPLYTSSYGTGLSGSIRGALGTRKLSDARRHVTHVPHYILTLGCCHVTEPCYRCVAVRLLLRVHYHLVSDAPI